MGLDVGFSAVVDLSVSQLPVGSLSEPATLVDLGTDVRAVHQSGHAFWGTRLVGRELAGHASQPGRALLTNGAACR